MRYDGAYVITTYVIAIKIDSIITTDNESNDFFTAFNIVLF